MGYIRAIFLGKEYSIPEDVLTYIDLLSFTDGVKTQLANSFVRKLKAEIQKDNIGLLGDEALAAEIERQVGKFIAKLCDHGIFTRTISDYLKNNKGYELYSNVNKAALEKMKSILIQEMDDWQAGYENAVNRAESHVTGMGFSIWSGSFVNHAIYAAMEASTLNKQGKEAEALYQKDMDDLRARLDSQYGGEKSNYINNTYIPNMEAAFTVFAYELLDKYVADLIANGKFDGKTLDYIDIGRSNDLLKNLTLSNNKKVILENAFSACPYNIAVYMQAMQYDLLDYESFQTAKLFNLDGSIISFLEENLGGAPNSDKRRLNFKYAELLSLYTGRSLREITAYVADFIVDGYAQTVAAFTNNASCYNIMAKVNEENILAGNRISKEKTDWVVDPLAPAVLWDKLTSEYGHYDLLDRLLKLLPDRPEVSSKEEYDALLKDRLFVIFEAIRQERVATILAQRQEEVRLKEVEAEKARRTAERNKKIKKICFVSAIVIIVILIASTIITKLNNARAYREMAGEFCVYRVINDEGEEKDEFNWWLSISEDGTIKMSSWSYAYDDTAVNSYSGELKNKADYRNFEGYQIEDYCADISAYREALYCYEFHIADEWDEFDGYIVCWQYHNGKIVDVYCDNYRYSFVETSDDYSFNMWESEINSDELSKSVQKLIDNIDVSEEDVIEEIEKLISSGSYDKAVKAIVDCQLSDAQKNTYFDSLVEKIDFKSFEVNGLVVNIPEHWYIEDYSDPNIRSAKYPEKDSPFSWYVKCMGTVEQVVRDGDDGWRRDDDYSPTTVAGCEEAYSRRELSKKVNDEVYSVIDYYVVCQGFVYKIQYFAYNERFFEPEMRMLLDRVDFTGYAENRAEIQEQKYLNAISLLSEGKYEEALSIFVALDGYKESEQKITECNDAIAEEKYSEAIALANEGKYKDAILLFDEVGDYKDAAELRRKYALLACEAGDVIIFGAYEQDNNLDNGAESIEWIVLKREGNKALVISKYCLEQMPFNNTLAPVTWENCTVRKWLNNDFFNTAFSADEKTSILISNISYPDDADHEEPAKTTTDRIFLLSENEALIYFDSDSERAARTTEYVGALHCYWILRTNGSVSNVAHVDTSGHVGYYENVDREWYIRPAMWIEVGN